MKIAIYSPYLDTASGGEKYMLTIAEVLSGQNDVDVLLDKHLLSLGADFLKQKNAKVHDLSLEKVHFKKAPIGLDSSFLERFFFLKKYDWFFYLSDGSIPYSSAKNNVLHFQMPLEKVAANGLWGEIKKSRWNLAIYNSKFTKDYIEKRLNLKGKVVYPPVDVLKISSAFLRLKPISKKNQIITVGRFAKFQNPKKQEIIIKAFKEIIDIGNLKGWSLHLVGGMSQGNEEFFGELEKLAVGYPIKFYPNAAIDKLHQLYGESKIYWHAMGYGENDPKLSEHFGITTVEAMAAGCVPVVINKGGQREIVEDKKSGLLFDDLPELKELTNQLAKDNNLLHKYSKEAIERSKIFSKEIFSEKIINLIHGN